MTHEQMKKLAARLDELARISAERDAASAAHEAASRRWNEARTKYARLHAEVVDEFGEENAPVWIDLYHGPRAQATETQPSK